MRRISSRTTAIACACIACAASSRAGAAPEADKPTVTPLGYVETSFSWNFDEPSNRITNARAFDDRHDSFMIENVALGAAFQWDSVAGKLVLQAGDTPNTYYSPGDGDLKFVQEAHVGWKAPLGRGLLLEAGIFPSPIGPEVFAIKDDWSWSRSNLFFALPFYHAGLQATYDFGKGLSATLGGDNGWNHVIDNNDEKSVSARVNYARGVATAQLLYFGGVERDTGAPEGPYWRSDFDAFVQLDLGPRVSFLAQANAGFEPNRFGTSSWAAGAVYARVMFARWLYASARGDVFYEHVPPGATPIFWSGVDWVSSGTITLDARPTRDHLSVRLEYRHDRADGDLYFAGTVDASGAPNARSQDTLTLGATAWF
jgi:hypothetical protein